MKSRKSNKAKHIYTACKNNGACKTCTSDSLHAVNRLALTREEKRDVKNGDA